MRKMVVLCIACTFVLSNIAVAMADAAKGQGVYMNFCASCHDSGLAGAPKVGDKADWQKRLDKGEEAVIQNAINGYQGETGFMPAKGGMSSLSDEEVSSAVQYMLEQSQ
jgi:cytochrome c5